MAKRKAINFGSALGAVEAGSIEVLTLYIPSRDRGEVEFDFRPWVDEALRLLSRIGNGATAMPPADGAWLDTTRNVLIKEKVTLVYTFIDPDKLVATLPDLKRFLHRLGRETGQGEVVCEFDRVLYKISDFEQ